MVDVSSVEHDDWHQVDADDSFVVAEWSHFTRPLGIRCLYGANGEFNVVLLRYVEADGYHAPVETTSRLTDEESVDETVESLMADVADSDTTVVAIGAEESSIHDETFVTFYCVYDSELPDGIEPDDLTFDDVDGVEPTSVVEHADSNEDLPDADISVHGYTAHESEVTER